MSIFEQYFAPKSKPPEKGFWENFAGVITDCSLFPHANLLSGQRVIEAPEPDDGVYGTANEHLAVLEAVDRAVKKGQKDFAMVELGAGWGPWISEAGVLCKRKNITDLKLIGVEADRPKFDAMIEHFKRNNLEADGLIFGAAWDCDATLKFPVIAREDMGGAASTSDVEYRGGETQMVEVPAHGLQKLCDGLGVIDVMHWDVQGAEARIGLHNRGLLDARVRSMQIGTHSRAIEGQLIEMFYSLGWDVLRELPCKMLYDKSKPTIEGMTTSDGEIYARNPKLWA